MIWRVRVLILFADGAQSLWDEILPVGVIAKAWREKRFVRGRRGSIRPWSRPMCAT